MITPPNDTRQVECGWLVYLHSSPKGWVMVPQQLVDEAEGRSSRQMSQPRPDWTARNIALGLREGNFAGYGRVAPLHSDEPLEDALS